MKHLRTGAIVIGSFNAAKAAEMAVLLQDFHIPVKSLADCAAVGPVPEEGETFADNARAKALGLARQLPAGGLVGVVADDSGLEVDALDRRPGVRSARYLGETATYSEKMQGILRELADLHAEQRTARFRCAVAFADAEKVLLETEGVVEGRIALAPAGTFGFGYDPIFIPRGYNRTFAELGPEVKQEISHRAMALRRFQEALARLLEQPTRLD